MGNQPHDAADYRDVAELLLACHVLNPQHKQAFSEVRCEMDDDEWKAYARRLEGRNYTAITPADAPAARAVLLGIVDKAIRRLNLLATTHQERDAQFVALSVHALAFDDTPEGERLRGTGTRATGPTTARSRHCSRSARKSRLPISIPPGPTMTPAKMRVTCRQRPGV